MTEDDKNKNGNSIPDPQAGDTPPADRPPVAPDAEEEETTDDPAKKQVKPAPRRKPKKDKAPPPESMLPALPPPPPPASSDSEKPAAAELIQAEDPPAFTTPEEQDANPVIQQTDPQPVAQAAPRDGRWKGYALAAFKVSAGAATGIAVKTGVGVAAASVGASPLVAAFLVAAIGATAVAVVSTSFGRWQDMRTYNKTHQDDKAGISDFFNFTKTGHSNSLYMKRFGVSAALGGLGAFISASFIGDAVSDFLGFTDTPVPEAAVPEAVAPMPLPEVTVPEPVVPEPAMPEASPPAAEIVPEPEAPAPEPEIIVPVDPTAATIDEMRALLPENPKGDLATALSRLESTNTAVKAQALKDLGYFFANGFSGVTENDAMANRLYEAALDVSDGKNAQALHDLGYQLLHGNGGDVDLDRAHELLSAAKAGGNKLSAPMLDYMAKMGYAP